MGCPSIIRRILSPARHSVTLPINSVYLEGRVRNFNTQRKSPGERNHLIFRKLRKTSSSLYIHSFRSRFLPQSTLSSIDKFPRRRFRKGKVNKLLRNLFLITPLQIWTELGVINLKVSSVSLHLLRLGVLFCWLVDCDTAFCCGMSWTNEEWHPVGNECRGGRTEQPLNIDLPVSYKKQSNAFLYLLKLFAFWMWDKYWTFIFRL